MKEPTTLSAEPHDEGQAVLARNMARDSAIVFTGSIAGRGLQLILQLVLGRLLEPAGFGRYVLGISLLDIAKVAAGVGLDRTGVRYPAIYLGEQQRSKANSVAQFILLASLVLGVLAGWLLYALAPAISAWFLTPDMVASIRLFAFGLPGYVVATAASSLLRGANRMATDMVIIDLGMPLVNLVTVALAVLVVGSGLLELVVAYNVTMLVLAVWAVAVVVRAYPGITRLTLWHLPGGEYRVIVSYSLYMALISLGVVAMFRLDKLLLGGLVTAAQVGLYGAASMISQQNALVIMAINKVFSPRVASLYHQQRLEELSYLFKLLNRWSMATTFPMVLVTALLSREILGLVGPAFELGWAVLVVMSLGQFTNASTGSAGTFLNMSGYQKVELVNLAATILVDIVLILLLVPTLGVMGAAIAFAVATTIINLARIIEVYWLTGAHPFDASLWHVVLAGGVTLGLWLPLDRWLDWSGLVKLVGGVGYIGLVYLTALWLWGLQPEDRVLVRRFVGRLGLAGR